MSTTSDARAESWLRAVRDRWRALGVLDLLEGAVAAVWERNVARHDPGVAGDTAMTLGITSAENLRSRLLAVAEEWAPRGVRIGAPWNSLTLRHEHVVLHLMKAPPGHGRRPDFAVLRWVGEFRAAAAVANAQGYTPLGAQLAFDGVPAPRRPPDEPGESGGGPEFSHVVLVWTGDPLVGTTTGWLAVPWGPEDDGGRWLAVLPVWSHGPDEVPAPRPVPAVSIPFAAIRADGP